MFKPWNIFIPPRVVIRKAAEATMAPTNMPQAKLVEVVVLGLVSQREVQETREAINTVPGHRVIAHHSEKGQFLVTYRYEVDRAALDRAVQPVMRFWAARWVLGLPLWLLRLPRRD